MKDLFIGVDLQNDFMNKDGALYVSGAEEIKQNIKSLVLKLRDNVEHIFYTMDMHKHNDPEFSNTPDYKTTFPPHCIKGTYGSFVIPEALADGDPLYEDEFMDLEKVSVFEKNKFSVFEGNDDFLKELIKLGSIDNIYIFGVAGDVCVERVIDGLYKNRDLVKFNKLYIITDCIASINEKEFKDMLVVATILFGMDVVHVINSTDIKFGE